MSIFSSIESGLLGPEIAKASEWATSQLFGSNKGAAFEPVISDAISSTVAKAVPAGATSEATGTITAAPTYTEAEVVAALTGGVIDLATYIVTERQADGEKINPLVLPLFKAVVTAAIPALVTAEYAKYSNIEQEASGLVSEIDPNAPKDGGEA